MKVTSGIVGEQKGTKEWRLTTERMVLRFVELNDVTDDYIRWMNDELINRYMETRFRPQKREDIEKYIKAMRDNGNILFLAMTLKENNKHIGNIKLDTAPVHKRGEISLWIGDTEQWGKGLATEAIRCVAEYAITDLGMVKVTAGCYSCNEGSAKAFVNAGFTQEAVLKQQYICGGRRVDRYCYSYFGPA